MKILIGHKKESGSILLIGLVASGILGFALASYMKMVEAQNNVVAWSLTWNSAIPVGEAGIEEALTHINVIGSGSRAVNGWEQNGDLFLMRRTMGDNRYVVAINSDNPPTITSTGYVKFPIKGTEVARVIQVTTTRFGTGMRGMVAKGDITMNGNTRADSFDSEDPNHSTNGRYDAAKAKDGGFVGSVYGSVATGGGKVYGYLGTGPTGTATGNAGDFSWLAAYSGIQTGHYENDLNISFPDVQPPFNGGGYTPTAGTVTTTNYTYTSTVTTSTTYPSPEPAGGVTTSTSPVTTATPPPSGYAGSVTTNTSATSNRTYPTAGTYTGTVVTRTVTSGPPANRGTWYDYNRIVSYTYSTLAYTYNSVTTNSTVTTDSYDYVAGNGNYQMSSLSMSGSSRMLITGNTVLYVTGDIQITGQAQIIIAPGATLKLYVGGASAKLSGNGVMNYNTADASSFAYYGLPGNTELHMGGNAAFTGTIYAPNADFHLGGGGNNSYDCVGATVTKTVKMNGHFNFHYDEKLGRQSIQNRYKVASWSEM